MKSLIDKRLIGKVVYSKAGRDADKYYLIVSELDDEYVYISDGDIRKIENPKKKKLKHLNIEDKTCEDIRNLLLAGHRVSNTQIRKFLQSEDINKEV